ncbi:MAG: hypothetical protein HN948_06220, partial [Clostridia bacterium]|nr:hypothetical protein [Clostridia bacterium]
VDDVALLKGVCRIQNDAHLNNIKAMLEKGVKVVMDSWFQCSLSTGWSIDTYKDVFLPLIKEVIDLAHSYDALFVIHDDGKLKDVMGFLADAGADCVSGLQPPDTGGDIALSDAKRLYGDSMALMGGIDPCYTFDMGTTQTVRQATKQAIEDAGKGGGYILNVGEAISPEVSPELLYEFSKTAKEYGKY